MRPNTTPGRRRAGPPRITDRAAAGADHQVVLAGRLTARDRWLARMVGEYRVLSTDHLLDLLFDNRPYAVRRLRELYRLRVLDRFFLQLPRGAGTSPGYYVLDIGGATMLAHEDGLAPAATGYSHSRAVAIAHSTSREHTLTLNRFFTRLVALARQPGSDAELLAWWSEYRCALGVGDLVRPDGYGRWREGDQELAFFVEVDRSTENLGVVGRKLAGYHALAAATGLITPVLFWLPSARREAGVRGALASARDALENPALVPAATATDDPTLPARRTGPAADRWLPVGDDAANAGRYTLAGLATRWPRIGIHEPRPAQSGRALLRPPALHPPTPETVTGQDCDAGPHTTTRP
jgi:hypothetical protein